MIDPTYIVSCFPFDSGPFSRLVMSFRKAGVTKFKSFQGNSFDYTAIIAVLEGRLNVGSHVVMLHDTMEITPETPALIEQADPESGAVAAFGGQCNLALYRLDYLVSRMDWILSLKGCTKKQAIDAEGRLWRECPTKTHFPNGDCQVIGKERPYGGAERIHEFYPALGVHKHKGNYGQTNERTYVLTP